MDLSPHNLTAMQTRRVCLLWSSKPARRRRARSRKLSRRRARRRVVERGVPIQAIKIQAQRCRPGLRPVSPITSVPMTTGPPFRMGRVRITRARTRRRSRPPLSLRTGRMAQSRRTGTQQLWLANHKDSKEGRRRVLRVRNPESQCRRRRRAPPRRRRKLLLQRLLPLVSVPMLRPLYTYPRKGPCY